MESRPGRAAARRELLRLGVSAAVAAVWTPTSLLYGAEETLTSTPFTAVGPFYPVMRSLEQDADLTKVAGRPTRAQGLVVHVVGRVRSVRGEPVAGARVELWQANTFGRYDHPSDRNPAPLDPGFQGYGVQLTDKEGRFRFVTVKPGPYPGDSGRIRTPHIHLEVTGRVDRRVTQLFFAGEPLNAQDRILQQVPAHRESLVAELLPPPAGEDPASRLASWDIVLPRG